MAYKALPWFIALFTLITVHVNTVQAYKRSYNSHSGGNLPPPGTFPRPGCDGLGFNKVLIYGTDTELDRSIYLPDLGDEFFQKQILGRTDAEIAAFRQMGLDYFYERLDWDFSESNPDVIVELPGSVWYLPNPEGTGGARLIYGHINPLLGYRPIYISGERIPDTCGAVWDGGYFIEVNGTGLMAHGTWAGAAGRHVPENSLMFLGDYLFILGKNRRPIQISYIPNLPGIPNEDGLYALRCNSTSDVYGEGLIAINMLVEQVGETLLRYSVRSYQSFPRLMTSGAKLKNAQCPRRRRKPHFDSCCGCNGGYQYDDYGYGYNGGYQYDDHCY